MKTIKADKVIHRGESRISLKFPYDQEYRLSDFHSSLKRGKKTLRNTGGGWQHTGIRQPQFKPIAQ